MGQGISPAKKEAVKLICEQSGHRVPSSNVGNVSFSIPKKLDEAVQAQLKKLGFTQYEIVPIHNVHPRRIQDALNYEGIFHTLNPKPPVEKEAKEYMTILDAWEKGHTNLKL